MQNLFMKNIERQKFELLKQLIYHKDGMTAQEIMNHLNISIHTVYRYQQQLHDDLSTVFKNNSVILIKKKGCYFVTIDDSLNLSFVIDTMSLYYIKISRHFSVLQAVMYHHYGSVEALAQEVNLSPSHTYKTVKLVNELFAPFNISIGFSHDRRHSNIQGDEKNLRLVMFYSYWLIFKGIEWPFYRAPDLFCDYSPPIKYNLLSPSQRIRLSYYQTFTYWQMTYRKQFVSLSPEFIAYLKIFDDVSPVSFPIPIKELLYKAQVSDSSIFEEELYFGFLARFYIANIDSIEDKIVIVNNLTQSELPLTIFASNFLNLFLEQFNVSLNDEDYATSYYQIMFNLLYIYFFGVNVPFSQLEIEMPLIDEDSTTSFDFYKKELIQFSYEQFSHELFPTISKNSTLLEYTAKLLYLVLKNSLNQRSLKVLLQYSKTSYGYDLIKNNLSIIFGKSMLEFTFNTFEADIIISDAYEFIEPANDSFYYFEYPYSKETWQELILFISQRLYENFS